MSSVLKIWTVPQIHTLSSMLTFSGIDALPEGDQGWAISN